ncbi:MAG TPA: chemotaxis protein CheW, partial [Terriglobales bacterium]|nr:chemotaxis protein CheW [Terriglobales bacterium]
MRQVPLDWVAIRKRLQANEDSLREALTESPARAKTVLRQRAVQLAQQHAASKPASESIPALIFRLGRERYAIALKDLAEVVPFEDCAQVPGGSPQFLGVINLRGELRSVIDTTQVLTGNPSNGSGTLLILRRQVALKVDAVEDLREIASEELARPVQGQFLRAFTSGTLGLLDVETILSALMYPKESQP